jgi:predicted transposase YbfD/YdcC
MKYNTAHSMYLQDGTRFNFHRRFKKRHRTLTQYLTQVQDGRNKRGKRHSLELILTILLCALFSGQTTVKDAHLWAINNRRWVKKYVDMPHGIACATTISRAIQVCDIDSLVHAAVSWRQELYGTNEERTVSMDGKTMRAVHGTDMIRHILSLFTHEGNQTLGQVGVSDKENEIPAAERLVEQVDITGLLLVADALHTQKDTANMILENNADYFLFVKGNQSSLQETIERSFSDTVVSTETHTDDQVEKGRDITTEIAIITDTDHINYIAQEWEGVACIGKIHRYGTRTNKGKTASIDETVYVICSRFLTAKTAARVVRRHWRIENCLHWSKDTTFLEDKQTLRTGNAPQVMSFLRSVCISICGLFKFASLQGTIKNFQLAPARHKRFLSLAAIV